MSPAKTQVATEETGWSERTVSWGHMIITLACMVGATMAWTWNATRDYAAQAAATERRLTQLEERYIQIAERNTRQDQQVAVQIGNIERKLDSIAADVVALKVQSATMQQQLSRARL